MRRTQRAIKHTLTERYYSWKDALEVGKSDPELDLSGEGPVYRPRDYTEGELFEPEDATEPGARPNV